VFTNNITVPILDDGTDSWIDKIFYVELSDPSTGVSIADSNITVYVSSYEGSVTFTCDDDSPLASWVNASPLFLEHNGAFTFYIPHVGNYTEAQWNQVLSLKTDGHEPGSHTFNHISVPDYVTANGMAAMINDQILTHKAATDAQDIRVSDFAYPFGSHTTATDTELLKYYKRRIPNEIIGQSIKNHICGRWNFHIIVSILPRCYKIYNHFKNEKNI
jgi:peptidoglycan/xylan/chitin deacetylase (PgdA/CDA1 family)